MSKKPFKAKALMLGALVASLVFAGAQGQPAHAAADGFTVERLSGHNREVVAQNVADQFFSGVKTVIVVNRDAFADAVSATNISQGKYPILYTNAKALPDETAAALKKIKPTKIYVMGGPNSVSESTLSQIKSAAGTQNAERVGGKNRYEVSANSAKIAGDKKQLILTTGQVYSDALVAAPVAKQKNAVVLLIGSDFSPEIKAYLQKYGKGDQATIIGGTYYVPAAYESTLNALTGTKASRINGKNRYEVSAQVASNYFGKSDTAFIASGEVFSDALVASAPAQQKNAPIVLVQRTSADPAVKKYITGSTVLKKAYIIGGPNTIAEGLISAKMDGDIKEQDIVFSQATGGKQVVDISTLPAGVQNALKTLKTDMSTKGAQEFVAALNAKRQKAGVSPLKYDPNLSIEAAYRALVAAQTGNLPVGGQYWAGDEYYRVTGMFVATSNLMDALNDVYLDTGGSSTVTAIGLAHYSNVWSFYFGGDLKAATSTQAYRDILSGSHQPSMASEVLSLLNQVRKSNGVGAVAIDPVLQKLAEARAQEATGLMTHVRPDGLKYTAEFNGTGMYLHMGESLASVATAQEFIDGLMNHGPHRDTVINPVYTKVGIGAFKASDGRMYWDVVYGDTTSHYNPNFQLKDLSSLY